MTSWNPTGRVQLDPRKACMRERMLIIKGDLRQEKHETA